jgi:hypothetical protein
MPSPLIIFQESGYIISFGSLFTVTILPSKCVIVFSKPKSDSWRFKVMSKYKLLPTLLNVGWGFYFTVNIKSPLPMSGTYSASFSSTCVSPWAVPFSKSKSTYLFCVTNLFPRHCLHLAAIDWPLPLHFGQCYCIYIYMPIPTFTFCMTTPYPLHLEHFVNLPSRAPVPLQSLQ